MLQPQSFNWDEVHDHCICALCWLLMFLIAQVILLHYVFVCLLYVSYCTGDSVALCIRISWAVVICMIIVCAWSYHSSMISVYARIVLPRYYPYVSIAQVILLHYVFVWLLLLLVYGKVHDHCMCTDYLSFFMLHIAQVMLLHLCIRINALISWLKTTRLS